MIWKGLMVMTGVERPIGVVLSGSMKPAFYREDLIVLTKWVENPIRVDEMMVFRIEGREILIVHKIRKKENDPDPDHDKGDNNSVEEIILHEMGQYWLEKKDGVVRICALHRN